MWPINASACRSLSANTPLPSLTLTLNLNFHYLCTYALYLADDCRLVSDSTRRSLRSADVSTCVVPPTLSSYGNRTFVAAGPRLWNSLPIQLRNPDITYTDYSDDSWRDTFFGKHEHGAVWLLICGAIENTFLLTYLLHNTPFPTANKHTTNDVNV